MGGEIFPVTLYALPLVGLDLVMGVQWLGSLGSTLCDWNAQTMKFTWASKEITLKGLDSSNLWSNNKIGPSGTNHICHHCGPAHRKPYLHSRRDAKLAYRLWWSICSTESPSTRTQNTTAHHVERGYRSSQCSPIPLCLLPERWDRTPSSRDVTGRNHSTKFFSLLVPGTIGKKRRMVHGDFVQIIEHWIRSPSKIIFQFRQLTTCSMNCTDQSSSPN